MRIAFYCDLYYKSCYLKQSSVSFMIMMTMTTKSDVVFVDKHSLLSYENVKLNFTLQKLFCKKYLYTRCAFLCVRIEHADCLRNMIVSLYVPLTETTFGTSRKNTVNVHYVIITYYTSLATFVFVYTAKIMIFH